MYNNSFDWNDFLLTLLKILGAFALAFPIAWEREKSTRVMGLRTFPLVAVASCVYVLMAIAVVGQDADPQARIIQGLMGGIGFIGGGAILKEGSNVRGTATAASVWSTGALGACVAYGLYDIAVVLSLVNYLILRLLTPIERKIGPGDQKRDGQKRDEQEQEEQE
jgi:putative Mg2+ transporter-C (MgtC) family protein